MPFRRFNRGMGLRPVNRIKHVRDSQGATAAGTQVEESIIIAVDAPVIGNTFEVQTGSTINGIYLKVEITNTQAAPQSLPNCYLAIMKNPGFNLNPPQANAVGVSDDKRYVIHQEMIMFQKQENSNPRTLFNGVIKIPRGYKRFGPNDRLQILILSPGVSFEYCWQAHYKEFR